MDKKTSSGLVEFCKSQLGMPYWYSCYGQKPSVALYNEILNRYPEKVGKWSRESYMEQLGYAAVYDCSGLIKSYMFREKLSSNPATYTAPVYNSKYDLSANGMIDACKETGDYSSIPDIPGLIVWKSGHVGVYIGGGKTIEAAGHTKGTILTTSTPWKKWGKLPWIEYSAEPTPTPTPTKIVDVPMYQIKKGDHDPAVGTMQIMLRYYGYIGSNGKELAVDNSFGSNSAYALANWQKDNGLTPDSICGEKSWRKLLKAAE